MVLNIWTGMLLTAGFLTLIKIILYRFNPHKEGFSGTFFTMDSWMDYVINISITLLAFLFNVDVIRFLNPLLGGINPNLQIPELENKGFIFILGPILISTLGYKLARKHISKPLQEKLAKSRAIKTYAPKVKDKYEAVKNQKG